MAEDLDLTLRFVTEFQCTGAECPDNCCHAWQVNLDHGTYRDLEAAMGADEAEAERFKSIVQRNPAAPDGSANFATIGLDGCGACGFQESGSGLCTIQRDYGEELLGQVCSTYPRQINRFGARSELSLALSCPEAARLCLSSPTATQVAQLDPALISNPRYFVTHNQAADESDPYLRESELVRDVLWQLLGVEDHSTDSRLFFAAYFAHRISPFYRRGMQPGEQEPLAAEVKRMLDPGLLAQLDEQFKKIPANNTLALTVILTILVGRDRDGSGLQEILQDIWANYGEEGFEQQAKLALETGSSQFDFGSVIEQFNQRRARLQSVFGDSHDVHIRNYCQNFVFREVATDAPSPLAHVQNLLIRRAILRFLVFSDPRWNEWLDSRAESPNAEQLQAFEERSITIFYKFSRAIEHSAELTQRIQDSLASQGMQSLAHLVMQLKI